MNIYELDTQKSIDPRRYNIYFIRNMEKHGKTTVLNVFKKNMVIYH